MKPEYFLERHRNSVYLGMSLTEAEKNKVIEDFAKAFGVWAIGDIETTAAKKKPLAAFILCACWLDQVSTFMYGSKKGFGTFIEKFMPSYDGLQLYETLRNGLVHNYSTKGNYRLLYNKSKKIPQKQNLAELNIHQFITDIKQAFEDAKLEIDTKNQVRNHIINWDKDQARFLRANKYEVPIYTVTECKKLISYYSKPLIGKRIIDKIKEFRISKIIKRRKGKGYSIEVISDYKGREYYYELTDAAIKFKLELPHKVLTLPNIR